jgi:endonuclease-3
MDSSKREKKRRAYQIFKILKEEYPDARPLLDYSTPFELLIATILAAQCTDERVNAVTPGLFKKYPGPQQLSEADISDIEKIIRSTGFFQNKAKSLKGASRTVMTNFNGGLPNTVEELITLPGVGRKTANVVVGNCFDTPAIMVDTHVKRVSQRLGLTISKNPDKIEMELKDIIAAEDQTLFSKVINFLGRYVCMAKKPLCKKCKIEKFCIYPDKVF